VSKKGVTPDETLVRFPGADGQTEAERAGGCGAECPGAFGAGGLFTAVCGNGFEAARAHGKGAAGGDAAFYKEKVGPLFFFGVIQVIIRVLAARKTVHQQIIVIHI